ncbi:MULTISPECIES: RNA-directed DNA polymerase [Sphingomonadaceae]|uniref:RNA-directed DNA polymerase n=1 Tax=Blastomonas fulva TaxID=1550728 RepID=UPI004033CD5A
MFIPGASEALAEASLLAHCSPVWEKLRSAKVFSYHPTDNQNRKSYFDSYMIDLRRRQKEILLECNKIAEGVVAYIDIKSFYPSLSLDIAEQYWTQFCRNGSIDDHHAHIGRSLIRRYRECSITGGLLVGPMFSHFLANLVLSHIDIESEYPQVSYFRYVDDITFVGPENAVRDAIEQTRRKLGELGLAMHPFDSPKTMVVPIHEWAESANDFVHADHSLAWMRLVGDIKKLILTNADIAKHIERDLAAEGFRLPIPDYAVAVREASSFEKIRQLGLWSWLKVQLGRISTNTVIHEARSLADRLSAETLNLLKHEADDSVFQRKRVVTKLRYRLGRLVYLATMEQLEEIADAAERWPELAFHRIIIEAIISGDCSPVLELGTNAAQATAQIFRANRSTARFSRSISTPVEVQGLAVFILNGVPVEAEVRSLDDPALNFARGPIDVDLMRQPSGLIQELACLHGIGPVRHAEILRSAFDVSEMIMLDALEFEYAYSF